MADETQNTSYSWYNKFMMETMRDRQMFILRTLPALPSCGQNSVRPEQFPPWEMEHTGLSSKNERVPSPDATRLSVGWLLHNIYVSGSAQIIVEKTRL